MRAYRTVKKLIANLLAKVTNWLLTRLKNGVPQNLAREEIRFAQITFAQFGEDIAVLRWVDRFKAIPRIYVDVGCYHPIHFSNTLLLHKRGWKGVNVDLDKSRITMFERLRPGDYNVLAAVSSSERELKIFEYEGGLTDRLGEVHEENLESVIGQKPTGARLVKTRILNSILQSCPWPVGRIGYLNIDCEGHDLEVLKGLDLDRYRPAIISIEAFLEEERRVVLHHLISREYEHKETIYKTLLFVKTPMQEK
jgi:FkbM family methyltransferase